MITNLMISSNFTMVNYYLLKWFNKYMGGEYAPTTNPYPIGTHKVY